MATAQSKAGSLAEALVALQAELPIVPKNHTATVPTKSGGSYRYTYADLSDIVETAKPLMAKHGLSFSCTPRRAEDGSYELVGILRHTSGEYDEGALPMFGRTPQELGGSITYNRRYLLGCMTGLVTDDDNDGQHAQNAARTQRQEPEPPPAHPNPLEAAQADVWDAWQTVNPGGDMPGLQQAYASDHDGDITACTPQQLHEYAAELRAAAQAAAS
jgi:hypothetical protein